MKLEIIDTAMHLIELFEYCDDTDFIDIVCGAVCEGNIKMLLDLEETFNDPIFD